MNYSNRIIKDMWASDKQKLTAWAKSPNARISFHKLETIKKNKCVYVYYAYLWGITCLNELDSYDMTIWCKDVEEWETLKNIYYSRGRHSFTNYALKQFSPKRSMDELF